MGGAQIDPGRRDREGRADPGLERDGRLPDLQARDPRRHPRARAEERRGRARARLQARRLPPGDRPADERSSRKAKTSPGDGYVPRLKDALRRELRAALKDELELASVMQVPRIQKITLNMGVGEAKTDAKALDAAIEELTTIAGQRAEMRRARKSIAELQAPRGDADRRARHAARRAHVGVPRPARVDRAAADPRLPRAQPALVRRPRQLLARHPRADHLPGDRLRLGVADPRPRRRDHDDAPRRTSRPSRSCAGSACRSRDGRRETSSGQEVADREGRPHAALQGAQATRAAAAAAARARSSASSGSAASACASSPTRARSPA